MNTIFPGIAGAFVGGILGSFTTLLVHRLHFEEKGIFWGRSRCPSCQKKLGVRQLVPFFSWLFYRGRCAFCHRSISWFYLVTELVFIASFFIFVQKFYSTDVFWPLLTAVFFTLVLFVYDLRFLEVDRRISFPAIGLAFIWIFFRDAPVSDFLLGGVIGFLFYAFQYFLSRHKKNPWVGAGDMELGLFAGLLVGWQQLLVLFFIAYIFGLLVALPLLCTGQADRKTPLPMGAFLMPALLLFLYTGEKILHWYIDFFGLSFIL